MEETSRALFSRNVKERVDSEVGANFERGQCFITLRDPTELKLGFKPAQFKNGRLVLKDRLANFQLNI